VNTKNRLIWAGLTILAELVLCVDATAWAQDTTDIAEDTCVLEMNLPARANISIDGRDYGTKRELTFRGLQPEKTYHSTVHIRFADGGQEERRVFIEGGRRIQLAVADPTTDQPRLALQTGHSEAVKCVAISPNGRYIASGVNGTQVILWKRATGRQLRTLVGLNYQLQSLAFSADSQWLTATAFYDDGRCSEVAVWDVATGEMLRHIPRVEAELKSVAASSDGQSIVAAGNRTAKETGSGEYTTECFVHVWDVVSGRPLDQTVEFRLAGFLVSTVAQRDVVISRDGRYVLFAASEEKVVVDVATGQKHPFDPEYIGNVSFSWDGNKILAAVHKRIGLWDRRTGRQLGMVGGPVSEISQLSFSRDGKSLLSVGDDYQSPGTIQLWDVETGFLRRTLRPQEKEIAIIAIAPDGRRGISVADGSKKVLLWDSANGDIIHTLAHNDEVRGAQFGPDGKHLITHDFKAILWDTASGEKIRELGEARECAVISPDGRYVLTDSVLRELSTGNEVRKFKARKHNIEFASFSADSRRLVTIGRGKNSRGDRTHNAIVWDVGSGQTLRTVEGSKRGYIRFAQFSPDGDRLLVRCWPDHDDQTWEDTATIWSVETGRQLLEIVGEDIDDSISAAALSPDGRVLATGVHERVVLRDSASGRMLRTLSGHDNFVQAVVVSPDGQWIAAASWDHEPDRSQPQLLLWNVATGAVAHDFGGHQEQIHSLTITPDGKQVLTGGEDGIPILWDLSTGKRVRAFQGNDNAVNFVKIDSQTDRIVLSQADQWIAWVPDQRPQVERLRDEVNSLSADGAMAFTCSGNQPGILWETETGRTIVTVKPRNQYFCSAISDNHRYLVTSTVRGTMSDGGTCLWDARTGNRLHEFAPGGLVNRVTFNPDSRRVILASGWKGTLRSFDVPSGRQLSNFTGHTYWTVSLDFSTDGRRLATGSLDRQAIIWNVADGRRLHTLAGHISGVRSVKFSPRDRYVATGADDGTVKLWEVATGRLLRTLEGHQGAVISLLHADDGTILLTSSRDGTVRFWDIATGQQLAAAMLVNNRSDWLAVTPEGLFDGSAGGRQEVSFRVGGDLKVVPVDRFFQDFYYPGLLSAVWSGERPVPEMSLGKSLPPTIRIVTPTKDGTAGASRVTIEVDVTDQGGGVKGPWIKQNGARVLVQGTAERTARSVRRKFPISLVEGENRIEIHAASADGSWESEPAVLTLRYAEPLEKPELYVLAVGINDYQREEMRLEYATVDAQAMAALFQRRGPELYKQAHVHVLEDESATRSGILRAIRGVGQVARKQDTVIVFLAGHGTVVDSRYYFLPHDFERTSNSLEEDVRSQGLPTTDIGTALAAVPSLKRMLLLDTCQSGGAVAAARTARDPFALRGAIERLARAEGAFSIAGVATSEKAAEVSDLGHGVLTYSLLAGLRAVDEGPLKDRWLRVEDPTPVAYVLPWFNFASSHVPELTQKYFGSAADVQHNLGGTSFPVLPVPLGDPSVPSEVATPTRPSEEPLPVIRPAVKPGEGPALHFIAIGVNKYQHEAMNLRFAAPDARAMAGLFRQRGPGLYGTVSVTEVIDGQATKTNIEKSLQGIAKTAKPSDTLIVFLAGHGTMVGQRYYFIPHDFRRQAAELNDDVRAQGLPADVLADAVAAVPALKRVLILDTCASGGALEISRQGGGTFAFRGAIEKLNEKQGVFTIAASSASDEAQEIEALGHGVLTYALLAGLRAVGGGPLEGQGVRPSGPSGTVDVLDWLSYAAGHVPRLTERYLGQVQDVQTSGQGQSFPLLPLED